MQFLLQCNLCKIGWFTTICIQKSIGAKERKKERYTPPQILPETWILITFIFWVSFAVVASTTLCLSKHISLASYTNKKLIKISQYLWYFCSPEAVNLCWGSRNFSSSGVWIDSCGWFKAPYLCFQQSFFQQSLGIPQLPRTSSGIQLFAAPE